MENGVKFANMNGAVAAEEKSLTNGHVNGEVNGTTEDLKLVEKSVKENFAPGGDRIKRKAKRLTKLLAKGFATTGQVDMVNTPRHLKNFRKPRNGFGRGLPKKGGAGGKGTWGMYGSELSSADSALDYKDPNYDPESLDNGDIHLAAIIPEMSDEEIQKSVESVILEYFEHGDTGEVHAALEEMNIKDKRYMVIVVAIEAAMDHKPSHREMTSILISDLMDEAVSSEDIVKAFEKLLSNLPDLILDTPDAVTILGNFIARAAADDCIVVDTVHEWKKSPPNPKALSAVNHAEALLVNKVGMLRLNNIWGVGGGAQPVKALARQIYMLLQEYLSSNDATEAERCVRELEVPHFHHEIVYEAIVMAMEHMSETKEDAMCRLLKSLFNSCVITPEQMDRGFLRVFDDLPDICLDIPAAYSLIDRFVSKANRYGVITDEIVRTVPTRGRKRFVSEGDGGKVKEEEAPN